VHGAILRPALVLVICLTSAGCVRAFEQRGFSATDASAKDQALDSGFAGDAAGGDAGPPHDGAIITCPKSCNKGCAGGVCHIECGLLICPTTVVCPPAIPCEVTCGHQACFAGVDCSAAKSCTIRCNGAQSCAGGVICGKGPCSVACGGVTSCAAGVNCAAACSCSVTCGLFSCAGGVTCPQSCTACGPKAGCDSC
jgi:hypothetical protein